MQEHGPRPVHLHVPRRVRRRQLRRGTEPVRHRAVRQRRQMQNYGCGHRIQRQCRLRSVRCQCRCVDVWFCGSTRDAAGAQAVPLRLSARLDGQHLQYRYTKFTNWRYVYLSVIPMKGTVIIFVGKLISSIQVSLEVILGDELCLVVYSKINDYSTFEDRTDYIPIQIMLKLL